MEPPFHSGQGGALHHVRRHTVPKSVAAGKVRVIKLFRISLILKHAALIGMLV